MATLIPPLTVGTQNPWQMPSTYSTVNHVTGLPLCKLWRRPRSEKLLPLLGLPDRHLSGHACPCPCWCNHTYGTPYNVWPVYPPPIPSRRLFQVPDAYSNASNLYTTGVLDVPTIEPAGTMPVAASISPSNASETGDPTINVVTVWPNPVAGFTDRLPAGAIPPIAYANATNNYVGVLNNSVVNLYWPTS